MNYSELHCYEQFFQKDSEFTYETFGFEQWYVVGSKYEIVVFVNGMEFKVTTIQHVENEDFITVSNNIDEINLPLDDDFEVRIYKRKLAFTF